MTDDEGKPGSLTIVVIADDAGEDTKSQSPQLAALIKEALALKPGDDRGVIALLAKAAALGLDEMQADMLIKAINKATKLGLRMMRFLTVIKASAVLHKAQRETNADGAIVATLDDYAHAHAAFDEGLATEHGYADAKVIATVEAIEAMQVEELPDVAVKVTLRDLA